MSHFSVLVVGEDLDAVLQPFHEFECTGVSDQYVVDVDQTDEKREEFKTATRSMIELADGTLVGAYDDQFYREPTPEEAAKGLGGMGFGNGISWNSKDWGDGKGYRSKVHFVPEGAKEVKAPFDDFLGWLRDWQKIPVVAFDEAADLEETHKYGYVRLNEDGSVKRVILRTNPNKKWDWWVVGGRYKNRLLAKGGWKCSSEKVGNVDWLGMRQEAATRAAETYDKIIGVIAGREIQSWGQMQASGLPLGDLREAYHAQPILEELYAADALDKWCGAETLTKVLAAESREGYVERESKVNTSFWAFLNNGVWIERGDMGWWGMSDATTDSERVYAEKVHEELAKLPQDVVVSVVDCHI